MLKSHRPAGKEQTTREVMSLVQVLSLRLNELLEIIGEKFEFYKLNRI